MIAISVHNERGSIEMLSDSERNILYQYTQKIGMASVAAGELLAFELVDNMTATDWERLNVLTDNVIVKLYELRDYGNARISTIRSADERELKGQQTQPRCAVCGAIGRDCRCNNSIDSRGVPYGWVSAEQLLPPDGVAVYVRTDHDDVPPFLASPVLAHRIRHYMPKWYRADTGEQVFVTQWYNGPRENAS